MDGAKTTGSKVAFKGVNKDLIQLECYRLTIASDPLDGTFINHQHWPESVDDVPTASNLRHTFLTAILFGR